MKDILPLITAIIGFITPDPAKKNIRLERAELRLEKKKLRVAKKMYKQVEKEFAEDGFTTEETQILIDLKQRINARRMELI